MAFDPNYPADGLKIRAVDFRTQFAALHADDVAKDALLAAQEARIAALEAALAGTAQNPSVGTLNFLLSEPPTRDQVQTILDHLNALIGQITRV